MPRISLLSFLTILVLVFAGCSGTEVAHSPADYYFTALERHDSLAYLNAISTRQQQTWNSPTSSARLTFMVLQNVSMHHSVLNDRIAKDSSIDVQIVVDSVRDPRLIHTLKPGQKQNLRLLLVPENGSWKVDGVRPL